MRVEVTDTDPMASGVLPIFPNATLKCLIVRQNMTIEYWAEGDQRMIDFSLCLAKQYDRQRYILELYPGQS